MKKFFECNSINEFADNSAFYQRAGLYCNKYSCKNSSRKLEVSKEYNSVYKNMNLFLLEDIEVFVETDKIEWENQKNSIDTETIGKKILFKSSDFDTKLDKIATVAQYVRLVAHEISEISRKPTVVIFNARSATPYSYIYPQDNKYDVVMNSNEKEKLYTDFMELRDDMKNEKVKSGIIILNHFKISSREYVQTIDEAKLLSGIESEKKKLRKQFNGNTCYVNEYIPDIFLDYLKEGLPVVFVDVPTWGRYYASSTGLFRKQKDVSKRNKGIYTPYKFKTYMEYAEYQIASLSLEKINDYDNTDKLDIEEEKLDKINIAAPFCFILNPEMDNNIWWDNCPQITGSLGIEFSDNTLVKKGYYIQNKKVMTNVGAMNIENYIVEKIRGATIVK